MQAFSTSGDALFASGGSGSGAVASSSSGPGVFGSSASFIGTFGQSNTSLGGLGETFNTSTTSGAEGVEGFDENGSSPDLNIGVLGSSSLNIGVEGTTSSGTAVNAVASGDGKAINASATTGEGLHIFNAGTDADDAVFLTAAAQAGEAFIGESNGLGLLALGLAPLPSKVPALNATCFAAPAMTATNLNPSGSPFDIMSLDCSGNMILKGTLTQSGTPLAAHRTAVGTHVATFSAQQTVPTVEDVGEAQLTGGRAYVRIAPDYAATIDRQSNYLVFITPRGDSRGLYVTQTTSAGFEVRENGGGNSTLVFDYRIVAKPYGELLRRLPAVRTDMRPDASMAAALQQAVKAKAQVSADLARARAQALRARLQVQQIDRQVKALIARVKRPQ